MRLFVVGKPTECLFVCFQFKLQLSHDGSGKGAALVAAVAIRLRDIKKHDIVCDS